MPRPRRIEVAGGLYHILNRCIDGRRIFTSEKRVRLFLEEFGRVAEDCKVEIIVFCVMSNHFHAVIRTNRANLSAFIQRYSTNFSRKVNRLLRRRGPFWQGRHKTRLIDRENYFWAVVAYVLLNPVRAKMVRRCESYRWSSLALERIPEIGKNFYTVQELLEEYPDYYADPKKFIEWLNDLDRDTNRAEIEKFRGQFLGDKEFKEKVLKHIDRRHKKEKKRQRRRGDLVAPLISPKEIDKFIAKELQSKDGSKQEKIFAEHVRWWCYRELAGMTYEQIRERCRLKRHTVAAMALSRLRHNPEKRRKVLALQRKLGQRKARKNV